MGNFKKVYVNTTQHVDRQDGTDSGYAKVPLDMGAGCGAPDFPKKHGRKKYEINKPIRCLQEHFIGKIVMFQQVAKDEQRKDREYIV